MRYQSIIRFFEYAHIEYDVPQNFNLSRARKLVQAEFAMQADGIIEIDGFSYTKQDVLAELEDPNFFYRLEHHKRIWVNDSLLHLLERDKIDLSKQPSWFHLAYAPNFRAFVSEYFAPVFDRIMRSILAQDNFHNAAIWLDYQPFIAPENGEEAERSMRLYLSEVVKFFRNLNDESYKARAGELYKWHHYNWSIFINKLPDSLLGYVDEVISAIINFTVRIQKTDRTLCYELSKEMLLVNNANFSLKQLVRSNHETYKKNYESRTVKGYFGRVNYIYVVIVVVLWVARLLMVSSSRSSDGDLDVTFSQPPPESVTIQPEAAADDGSDNGLFAAQRSSFLLDYSAKKKTGFEAMDLNRLKTIPFAAQKVYFFVEGHNNGTLTLDTVAFENLTSRRINVDMIWDGNVYHHEVTPNAFVGFAIAKDKNIDLVVDFSTRPGFNGGNGAPESANNNVQYIHLRKDTEGPYNDIKSELGSPGELPYLLHSQLKEVPVFIKINEDMNHIYFDIQTKAQAVNVKRS